jgi:hypothetical protein
MWTASELAERYGLRVETQAADLVHSGSSGCIELEAEPAAFQTITVIKLLHRRGTPLLLGKRAVEALFDHGTARIFVEHIDEALEGELLACKVRMTVLPAEVTAAAG